MRVQSQVPISFWLLLVLLAFLGIGALGGGAFLLIDPSGASMQWSLEALAGSPFQNYLIPGLLLFTVFGVGSLAVLVALLTRPDWSFPTSITQFTGKHWTWSATLAIGFGQIIWIITQILMVSISSWLQPVCAATGVLIVLLTLEPGLRKFLALETQHDSLNVSSRIQSP
jgi:small-conductance mechanosensitive channel